MRKAVSVFLDIEDIINPLADDAARDLLQVFKDEGVRGCMCITGDKCRSLMERGRSDIVELMGPHCLGIHSDKHSCHPTTMELTADSDYETGCKATFEAEKGGVESFRKLFGMTPFYWGGPAFTWTPEVNYALRQLDVPAYIYALTQTPNRAVHCFDGVVALPHGAIIHETDMAEDELAWLAGTRAINLVRETAQPWVSVLVGHPTKYRHKEYWDTPYFAGRTPPGPEYVEPVPVDTFERSKANLRTFLGRVKEEFEIIGVDEVLAWPWKYRAPTDAELKYFDEQTPCRIRATAKWCVHYDGLTPENIIDKTMALRGTLEIGELPRPD